MKNIPLYLWNTIIYALCTLSFALLAVVDNKWYALVAALFGISSAFNAYRYVKDKQKKKRSNWGVWMKNLTYAIITGVLAVVLIVLTFLYRKSLVVLGIVFLGRSADYAYKYYQYRKKQIND